MSNINDIRIINRFFNNGLNKRSLKSYFEDKRNNDFRILEFICLHHPNKKLILYLFHKIDINIKNDCGRTILHVLCKMTSNKKIIKLLLENGADVNSKDINDMTPFHYLCQYNPDKKIMELLLDFGADINATDINNWTALFYACYNHKRKDLILFLLDHDADILKKDNFNWSVIQYACKFFYYKEELVITLLENGASITENEIDRLIKNNKRKKILKTYLNKNKDKIFTIVKKCNVLIDDICFLLVSYV